MRALLWIVGALAAGGAAVLAVAVERERVARAGYRAARAQVPIARRVWLGALRVAVQAVVLAVVVLACAWAISGRPR